jgi:hypothetical protein
MQMHPNNTLVKEYVGVHIKQTKPRIELSSASRYNATVTLINRLIRLSAVFQRKLVAKERLMMSAVALSAVTL